MKYAFSALIAGIIGLNLSVYGLSSGCIYEFGNLCTLLQVSVALSMMTFLAGITMLIYCSEYPRRRK